VATGPQRAGRSPGVDEPLADRAGLTDGRRVTPAAGNAAVAALARRRPPWLPPPAAGNAAAATVFGHPRVVARALPAAAPASPLGRAILASGSPSDVASQIGDDYDLAQQPAADVISGGGPPTDPATLLPLALDRIERQWVRGMFETLQVLRVNGSPRAPRSRAAVDWLVRNRASAGLRTRVALTAYAAPTEVTEPDLAALPADQAQEVRAFLGVRHWDDPVRGLPRKGAAAVAALTPEQDITMDYIRRRRAVATVRTDMASGPSVGLQYGGRPGSDPTPTGSAAGSLDAEIWQELDLEGSASAVNTWDNMHFTWGKGWAAQTTLGPITDAFFAADPDARTELMEAGFTYTGGQWLFVSLDQRCVLVGTEALDAFRDDRRFASLLANLVEDPAHQQKMVDAQWAALSTGGHAGAVPAAIRAQWPGTWTTEAVRFGAHCVHWGRSWGEVAATGPALRDLIAWISRIKGTAQAGGGTVIDEFSSGTIRHFANRAAEKQMGRPAPLPNPTVAGTFYFQNGLRSTDYWTWRP